MRTALSIVFLSLLAGWAGAQDPFAPSAVPISPSPGEAFHSWLGFGIDEPAPGRIHVTVIAAAPESVEPDLLNRNADSDDVALFQRLLTESEQGRAEILQVLSFPANDPDPLSVTGFQTWRQWFETTNHTLIDDYFHVIPSYDQLMLVDGGQTCVHPWPGHRGAEVSLPLQRALASPREVKFKSRLGLEPDKDPTAQTMRTRIFERNGTNVNLPRNRVILTHASRENWYIGKDADRYQLCFAKFVTTAPPIEERIPAFLRERGEGSEEEIKTWLERLERPEDLNLHSSVASFRMSRQRLRSYLDHSWENDAKLYAAVQSGLSNKEAELACYAAAASRSGLQFGFTGGEETPIATVWTALFPERGQWVTTGCEIRVLGMEWQTTPETAGHAIKQTIDFTFHPAEPGSARYHIEHPVGDGEAIQGFYDFPEIHQTKLTTEVWMPNPGVRLLGLQCDPSMEDSVLLTFLRGWKSGPVSQATGKPAPPIMVDVILSESATAFETTFADRLMVVVDSGRGAAISSTTSHSYFESFGQGTSVNAGSTLRVEPEGGVADDQVTLQMHYRWTEILPDKEQAVINYQVDREDVQGTVEIPDFQVYETKSDLKLTLPFNAWSPPIHVNPPETSEKRYALFVRCRKAE